MRFLSYCIDLLFPPRATELLVRGVTERHLAALVAPIDHVLSGYSCTTLLSYDHAIVRALLLEAKFRGSMRAQSLLGNVLRTFLTDHAPVVLVPIPLSSERRRARGSNQVEAILRYAAPSFPVQHLLTRTRDTRPQTEQSAEARFRNVAGAFSANPLDPIPTYLIIDDVTTTGATLQDAARALHEAGAKHIRLLALARA